MAKYQKMNMGSRKCCNINLDYLPIKAHYFFLFGGMGGTIPFMQVLAKDLGISATAVGLIYTIVPFCIFLAKPLFGYITDLFRNIKVIVMILLVATSLAFLAILFVPAIENESKGKFSAKADCVDQRNHFILLPSPYNQCLQELEYQEFKCEFTSSCLQMSNLIGTLNISVQDGVNLTFIFTFTPKDKFPSASTCECLKANLSYVACESLECGSTLSEDSESVYETYNFWLFAFLAIIAGTGSATTFCLSDAACYEVLGQNSKLYGRQRVWATISWGITTFFAGYLNDIASSNSGHNNYSPGFYLMLAFIAVDLVILFRLQLLKANMSPSICKDIGKIYQSRQTIIFSLGVFIVGALTGLVWNYQFWYLMDLGASQTLLGVVVAVQCLIAEVPFFFFSDWFIKTFGHFYCLIGSLAAFALRTGLYVLLKDPWMVLPIELLHGVTFAIFYTAMTLYATDCAPPGTEATMLGVLGGLFEGLGVATGSLLGGLGFDKLGGHQTFFVASMISLTGVFCLTIPYALIKRNSHRLEIARTSENDVTNYGSNSPHLK